MSDCMENLGDSIGQLKDSLSEMSNMRDGKDLGYKINSIQTWVSAALTDDDSCMDGFGGKSMDGSVKTAVRGRVVNVAHLTSNALAILNAVSSSASRTAASDAP
ncbi:21 kDa protein-like [Phalaenopsis equestris]|uniref:21 kDa protein-like n=1 Tax=Phalaenopsis equestris TaxID=78828 RepID=UPI0009E5F97E|nr:21 kDa protein-like [Phalaenopsis equestris]